MAGLSQIRREPAGRGGDQPLAPPGDPTGSSVLRMFRFERRWLLRIFETIFPGAIAPQLPKGAADMPLGRFIDDFAVHAPLQALAGLRVGIWMVMLAPVFILGRARSFLGLSAAEQVLLLDRMRRSRRYLVREALLFVKTVACLGFCGLATVQEPLGIHPTDETPPAWARRVGPEGWRPKAAR
jgi:hypothetical protein